MTSKKRLLVLMVVAVGASAVIVGSQALSPAAADPVVCTNTSPDPQEPQEWCPDPEGDVGTAAGPVKELLPCTGYEDPLNFDSYYLGDSFEDLPLSATDRRCYLPDPNYPDDPGSNDVSYFYGTCTPPPDGGCTPPLEVQTWPACERYRDMYMLDPYGTPLPRIDLTVQGVPASLFEDGYRLEIYTGGSTVVIFGDDSAQIMRAGNAIQEAPGIPSLKSLLEEEPRPQAQSTTLEPPTEGALDGTLACVS